MPEEPLVETGSDASTAGATMNEHALNKLRQALETLFGNDHGPSWTPTTCTMDNKWNVAGKFGFHGELFLFHCKKEPTVEFGHSLDTPRVKCDDTSIFERDSISAGCGYFERVPHRAQVWSCVWTRRECPFREISREVGLSGV